MSWLYSIAFVGVLVAGTLDDPGIIRDAAETSATGQYTAVKQDETERFEQTYPFTVDGTVSVENVNGSITVEAWDQNEIHLVAVKSANSREALERVSYRIETTAANFEFETEYDRNRGLSTGKSDLRVDITIRIPRTAVLDSIETVNGSVTASDFVTRTEISVVNGDVKVSNLSGSAEISTVNGRLNADFARLDPEGTISLETVNGTANLSIPSDSNATIRANSLNGEISNDFGLPVRKGQYVGRDLHGRVGNGGVRVKLQSVNGDLSIKRKSDGKQLSPATDLLGSTAPNRRGVAVVALDDDLNIEIDMAAALANAAREIERAGADREKIAAIREKLMADERFKDIEEFKNFEDHKFDFDTKVFEKQLEKAMKQKQEAFEKLRDFRLSWAPMAPMIKKQEGSFPVKNKPKVIVKADDCDVSIRGWDRDEVKYVVTEFAARNTGKRSAVTATEDDDTVRISVDAEETAAGMFRTSGHTRLEVFVPAEADLEVKTDGTIRLNGVTGVIDLKGSDGAIDIRESNGSLRLNSTDGQVRVIGFDGDIDATAVDSSLFLEGDIDKLSATAVDGDVVVTLSDKFAGTITSNVDISTDGIEFQRENARTWRRGSGNGVLKIESVDGDVIIRSMKAITVK